jgi:hypothetical protein
MLTQMYGRFVLATVSASLLNNCTRYIPSNESLEVLLNTGACTANT